jgi:hypothetical protein
MEALPGEEGGFNQASGRNGFRHNYLCGYASRYPEIEGIWSHGTGAGGLLISIPGPQAEALLIGLKDNGISHATTIVEVTEVPEYISIR